MRNLRQERRKKTETLQVRGETRFTDQMCTSESGDMCAVNVNVYVYECVSECVRVRGKLLPKRDVCWWRRGSGVGGETEKKQRRMMTDGEDSLIAFFPAPARHDSSLFFCYQSTTQHTDAGCSCASFPLKRAANGIKLALTIRYKRVWGGSSSRQVLSFFPSPHAGGQGNVEFSLCRAQHVESRHAGFAGAKRETHMAEGRQQPVK